MSGRKPNGEGGEGHEFCCCTGSQRAAGGGLSRRGFLGGMTGAALGGSVLAGLSWPVPGASTAGVPAPAPRRPLIVKPVFVYSLPQRRAQTSWRAWGGIQTQADADGEAARIGGELERLRAEADFPMKTLPLARVTRPDQVGALSDVADADVLLVYAAGGWTDLYNRLAALKKNTIIFVRHKSGPLYLWYEIISPRFLRQHGDEPAVEGIDDEDVVVDEQADLLWRLRALCGLKNTMGTRIVAVGGPSGWACPEAPARTIEHFGFDIRTVSYEELGRLIRAARADEEAVKLARRRAAAYLDDRSVSLETKKSCVENCFLLDQVFRAIMAEAGAKAITVNHCMGTIMPIAETTACLTLSTLNDDGYLAYCESDFVIIPAGVLLSNISGRPAFLNDPTFPHHGIMTMAHCTGPRKMDGKTLEPARMVTHFESDYGAAPKVEFRRGQKVTLLDADFRFQKWLGMCGEIVDTPFLPICRAQLDVRFNADTDVIAEKMRGFHWMLAYGDYLKEVAYALKRTNVAFENLG
ncbi:MAG: sugar isomerase [Planctomycetota bacterium]|nr:sugar isomerase [Planctomycetota bacterium]